MAGIAILVDLWRKSQGFNPGVSSARISHSFGVFSASAASFAVGSTFASKALFGSSIAYCDAGAALSEDYISNIKSSLGRTFNHDAFKHSTKQYNVELKPLFSAFELKTFAFTSIRSFMMFYLPLLEARMNMEDDDDDEDFLQNNQRRVDLVVPFKKSVKQIARESTVVTTRRVLERISVQYVSQRVAWKLLKDVPQSALRKAGRKMPTMVYFVCVSRTTFRGHMLGVAASWLVQVGIEVYRFLTSVFNPKKEDNNVDKSKQVRLLGQGIFMATFRCSSSLIFASIGAGIGATLFTPSTGQKIGCAAGDFAGPVIVAYCADKIFRMQV